MTHSKFIWLCISVAAFLSSCSQPESVIGTWKNMKEGETSIISTKEITFFSDGTCSYISVNRLFGGPVGYETTLQCKYGHNASGKTDIKFSEVSYEYQIKKDILMFCNPLVLQECSVLARYKKVK